VLEVVCDAETCGGHHLPNLEQQLRSNPQLHARALLRLGERVDPDEGMVPRFFGVSAPKQKGWSYPGCDGLLSPGTTARGRHPKGAPGTLPATCAPCADTYHRSRLDCRRIASPILPLQLARAATRTRAMIFCHAKRSRISSRTRARRQLECHGCARTHSPMRLVLISKPDETDALARKGKKRAGASRAKDIATYVHHVR